MKSGTAHAAAHAQDEQLVFNRHRFCRHCAKTARLGQPREGYEEVSDQAEQQTHQRRTLSAFERFTSLHFFGAFCQNQQFATHRSEDSGSKIKIHDFVRNQSHTLAEGSRPSWSPDGRLIAFYHDGAYYTIQPSGEGRRKFFSFETPVTGLWWSPDSSLVAYFKTGSFSDSARSTMEYLDWPS
jgi:hypothetical protein